MAIINTRRDSMESKIEPKRHGKPAERAAYTLSYYFKLMTSDDLKPIHLVDANVAEITSIVEDIIDAAVTEARRETFDMLRKYRGPTTRNY